MKINTAPTIKNITLSFGDTEVKISVEDAIILRDKLIEMLGFGLTIHNPNYQYPVIQPYIIGDFPQEFPTKWGDNGFTITCES